ncbi:hypothetical protein pb186bvf_013820 [Paramecium bursaria]
MVLQFLIRNSLVRIQNHQEAQTMQQGEKEHLLVTYSSIQNRLSPLRIIQNRMGSNSQITGKVGQTLMEEDQYDTLQKQIYLQQQTQYKQLAVKNQTSNIFAQQVPQEQPNEMKNYGNFYAGMPPTGPKSKANQQEEEAQNHKGYGIYINQFFFLQKKETFIPKILKVPIIMFQDLHNQ